MSFSEKIKQLRKKAGMSQEKLAEKLNVSRQAVTKWETEKGTPDIGNLISISELFNISLDDLISDTKSGEKNSEYLFQSVTEYDIDGKKRYDMQFGRAKSIVLSGYQGEKLRVCLASDSLPTLQQDFKLKIDDIKNRIDLNIVRKNGVSEKSAKEALNIFISLPCKYIGRIEFSAGADRIELLNIDCEDIEMDVKTPCFLSDNVRGKVEINCNLDMEIVCKNIFGSVELNQISTLSKIILPENADFRAVTKGIGTKIYYRKNGADCADFSNPESENTIELNGLKSELFICKTSAEKTPD